MNNFYCTILIALTCLSSVLALQCTHTLPGTGQVAACTADATPSEFSVVCDSGADYSCGWSDSRLLCNLPARSGLADGDLCLVRADGSADSFALAPPEPAFELLAERTTLGFGAYADLTVRLGFVAAESVVLPLRSTRPDRLAVVGEDRLPIDTIVVPAGAAEAVGGLLAIDNPVAAGDVAAEVLVGPPSAGEPLVLALGATFSAALSVTAEDNSARTAVFTPTPPASAVDGDAGAFVRVGSVALRGRASSAVEVFVEVSLLLGTSFSQTDFDLARPAVADSPVSLRIAGSPPCGGDDQPNCPEGARILVQPKDVLAEAEVEVWVQATADPRRRHSGVNERRYAVTTGIASAEAEFTRSFPAVEFSARWAAQPAVLYDREAAFFDDTSYSYGFPTHTFPLGFAPAGPIKVQFHVDQNSNVPPHPYKERPPCFATYAADPTCHSTVVYSASTDDGNVGFMAYWAENYEHHPDVWGYRVTVTITSATHPADQAYVGWSQVMDFCRRYFPLRVSIGYQWGGIHWPATRHCAGAFGTQLINPNSEVYVHAVGVDANRFALACPAGKSSGSVFHTCYVKFVGTDADEPECGPDGYYWGQAEAWLDTDANYRRPFEFFYKCTDPTKDELIAGHGTFSDPPLAVGSYTNAKERVRAKYRANNLINPAHGSTSYYWDGRHATYMGTSRPLPVGTYIVRSMSTSAASRMDPYRTYHNWSASPQALITNNGDGIIGLAGTVLNTNTSKGMITATPRIALTDSVTRKPMNFPWCGLGTISYTTRVGSHYAPRPEFTISHAASITYPSGTKRSFSHVVHVPDNNFKTPRIKEYAGVEFALPARPGNTAEICKLYGLGMISNRYEYQVAHYRPFGVNGEPRLGQLLASVRTTSSVTWPSSVAGTVTAAGNVQVQHPVRKSGAGSQDPVYSGSLQLCMTAKYSTAYYGQESFSFESAVETNEYLTSSTCPECEYVDGCHWATEHDLYDVASPPYAV